MDPDEAGVAGRPPRPGTGWTAFRICPRLAYHPDGGAGLHRHLRRLAHRGQPSSPRGRVAGRGAGRRRIGGGIPGDLHRRAGRYPVSAATGDASALPGVAQAAARLRAGIRLTIVALILVVIAALSGWWPSATSTAAVTVTGTSGQAWCGPLVNGPAGAISVRTANGVIAVPAQVIAQVRPVVQCP